MAQPYRDDTPYRDAGPQSVERVGAALGPHTVKIRHIEALASRANRKYSSSTVYLPVTVPSQELLASIVVVPGWACSENTVAAWGPFFASHGYLTMTIGTHSPFHDWPADRASALLDAVEALKEESARSDSALAGRLDLARFAVAGWSMGGGGCQLAALADPSLKCAIAFSPHPGLGIVLPCCAPPPAELTDTVPSLFIAGQCDVVACPCLVRRMFRKVRAPKLLLEIRGGDHAVANGPAGGNLLRVAWGCGACAPVVLVCGACCGTYSPCGAFDRSTGHAQDTARNGAIGGTALKWLSIFLRGEQEASSLGAEGAAEFVQRELERPTVASGWECEGLDMSRI